ncbi:MAG TPA: putative quinol monooxygenase [Candidatus Acidoferrum sp.]
MKADRRVFLQCLATAAVDVTPGLTGLAGPQGEHPMYGLIAKLTAVSGKRDELIKILKEGTGSMPGCRSYILAKDAVDENAVWVTEIWDSAASHEASLTLPAVKDSIGRAKPLVAGFERVAVTTPVAGVGFPS